MNAREYAVRLLGPAEEDLKDIVAYVALDSVSAALRPADRIEGRIDLLSDNPLPGKAVTMQELASTDCRFIVIGNCLTFYKVEGTTVYVHRILHGARDNARVLLEGGRHRGGI